MSTKQIEQEEWKIQTCRYCNCLKKHKNCGNPDHHKLSSKEQFTVFPCSMGAGFREAVGDVRHG